MSAHLRAFCTGHLGITKEHHEAGIHVILLVAVKERHAGVVGGKLHVDLTLRWRQHNIFDEPSHVGIPGHTANLKAVSMQMNGMIVAAVIDELKPIALTLMERDGFGV